MTEPMDNFERRLADELRVWTDGTPRRADYAGEAHLLAETEPRQPRRRLAPLLVAATALAAVAVTLAIVSVAPFDRGPAGTTSPGPMSSDSPGPSTSVEPTPSEIPTPSAGPSIPASGELELSEIAWWQITYTGFGTIPEDPGPQTALPGSFHELMVGTLDGRVTAVLALDDQRGFASGPYGTDVLVGDDDGLGASLFLVSALDGQRTDLLSSEAMIPAAVLVDGGQWVYYVKVDRDSGEDQGLWRWSRGGGTEQQVLPGPLGEPLEDLTRWWMVASPNGNTLAVQWCWGEIRCTTHIVDIGSDPVTSRSVSNIGWPRGMTDDRLLARGLPSRGSVMALDLETLEVSGAVFASPEGVPVRTDDGWVVASVEGPVARAIRIDPLGGGEPRTIPVELSDGVGPTLESLVTQHGVDAPDGWLLLWPMLYGQTGSDGPPDDWQAGVLVDVTTGEAVTLSRFEPVVARPECGVIPPSEVPSGLLAGPSIATVEEGIRFHQWGSGSDEVVQAVGVAVRGPMSDMPPEPAVTVRGHEARALLIGDEGISGAALVWEQDGCTYTVWLPAGTTLEEAVDYAGRY